MANKEVGAVKSLLQYDDMRRANKAAAPSSLPKRSHLDVDDGSAHHNHNTKVHKHKGASKSSLLFAIICGLAAMGTLVYVSKAVFSNNGSDKVTKKSEIPQQNKERYLPQQNRLLPPDSIYRTTIEDIHGKQQQLMDYSGSVSLVVNVACE